MLTQLLQVMTPDLIIQAMKSNPRVVLETVQKFDTFKNVSASLSLEQQLLISKNFGMLDAFLNTKEGKASVGLWAEEFCAFIHNKFPKAETLADIEKRVRIELEAKIREELRASMAIPK